MSKASKSWPKLDWDKAIDRVSKCVFRIYAGDSAGTGFLVGLGRDRLSGQHYATIATAWHVVKPLIGTTDDLKIVSVDRKTTLSSVASEVGFYSLGDVRYDTGLIQLQTGEPLARENELLPLFPYESVLARGSDIGWLGFPGMTEPELCFFHGYVSGYLNDPPSYLVDGVAINGVSGGPAFDNRTNVIGLVSRYMPNRLDKNTTLPGLLVLVPINAIRYWMEHQMSARVRKWNDIVKDHQ